MTLLRQVASQGEVDDWLQEIENDAIDPKVLPRVEQLDKLVEWAGEQLALEDMIRELEETLAFRKARHRLISEGKLPALLQELGVESFTMANGMKVQSKRFTSAKVNDTEAYDWFEDHGLAEIVKMGLNFSVRRTDKERFQPLLDLAATMNIEITLKESVHSQTLNAVLRDLIDNGKDMPPGELVDFYVGQRVTIK